MQRPPSRTRSFLPACVVVLACAGGSAAAEGMLAPDGDTIWPSWQTRVMLVDAPALGGARNVRRAALLGDYYLSGRSADPKAAWRGGFRATSGLMLDRPGDDFTAVRDTEFWPYVGLGYSGLIGRGNLGFSADLGLGVRGWEGAMRRVDLMPMLQLGVRYTF